jgi:hypothetical protein
VPRHLPRLHRPGQPGAVLGELAADGADLSRVQGDGARQRGVARRKDRVHGGRADHDARRHDNQRNEPTPQ